MKQGRNIILAIDGTALATSTNCEFEIEQDTIPVCSPKNSGRWKRYIPGRLGWSGSAEFLCRDWATERQIINSIKQGKKIHVSFHDPEGDLRYYGYVLLTRNGLSAKVGSLIRVPLSFVGNGELKEAVKLSTITEILGNKYLSYVETTIRGLGHCVEVMGYKQEIYPIQRTLVYDFPAGYRYSFYMQDPLTMVMYNKPYSEVKPYIEQCFVQDSEEAADGPNTWLVNNAVVRYRNNGTLPYFTPSVSAGTALTLLVKGDDKFVLRHDPEIYMEQLEV